MTNQLFLYTGAFLLIVWGDAHLFPTRSVVKGFGEISVDNKRIITMEWIIEGIALIFTGIIILSVTYLDSNHQIALVIYWIFIIMLNTFSLISLLTGFKIDFLPYKLCPLIFTTASVCLLAGMYL